MKKLYTNFDGLFMSRNSEVAEMRACWKTNKRQSDEGWREQQKNE